MDLKKSRISHVIWNLDDVAYKDRATTIMAAASGFKPDYFIEKFTDECGKRGALFDIKSDRFVKCLMEWQEDNQPINSVKALGSALTDFRHKYKLFTSKHTKYTKNAILEGISMSDVNEVMSSVPLDDGFERAAEGLHDIGIKQFIFSNASYPVVIYFKERYDMDYGEGLPVMVICDDKEKEYIPDMHGRSDTTFTGVADYNWDKLEHFVEYMEDQDIPLNRVAAIDDDHAKILRVVDNDGGFAVGYNVKEEDKHNYDGTDIHIIEGESALALLPYLINNWNSNVD